MKRPMTDEDLLAMLLHRGWIASRPPDDGKIDRLIFDLDAPKDADSLPIVERYHALRTALGTHRVPLVYSTPNGGIHVVYRIPSVSLEPLISGRANGVVPEAVMGAGLHIADGSFEIFPQANRAIRLPLGQGMALLDPETLRPIPDAAIGDVFDFDMLESAVQHMERWHAVEIDDLITHLGHMASRYRHQKTREGDRERQTPSRTRWTRPRISVPTRNVIADGLPGPGTRHEWEFRVGAAMWADPGLFGLPEHPTSEDVAIALTTWLASHDNGHSEEWAQQRRRCRSDYEAIQHWARDRYLRRDGHGQTAVDRMRNVGQIQGPARVPSFAEREHVLRIVDEAGLPAGPRRYRAEVWCFAALRAVREILWWRGTRRQPGETTVIAIAAQWMETWPFGSGRIDGQTAYLAYRELLDGAGLMVVERRHSHHPDNPFAGVATRYRVRMPTPHDASDLSVSIAEIRRRIKREKVYGRTLTLDEAIHALHVTHLSRDLDRYYGRITARRIQGIADLLIPRRRFA